MILSWLWEQSNCQSKGREVINRAHYPKIKVGMNLYLSFLRPFQARKDRAEQKSVLTSEENTSHHTQ
jgi:hypothetical protein